MLIHYDVKKRQELECASTVGRYNDVLTVKLTFSYSLIGLFSAAQSAEMSLDEIKFVLKGKGLFFIFCSF